MNESYIGQIMLFAGNFAPDGWALCNGQLLAINQYQALYAVIGTTYGGNGQTTFGVPNLCGRVPVSYGQAPGMQNYAFGEAGGLEAVTLNVTQMPAHNHAFTTNCDTTPGGAVSSPANAYLCAQDPGIYSATQNASMGAGTSQLAGGNVAHENRPPYLAMSYCIATTGIYPTRP